ncbi:hypothetical protein L1049_016047 [Liquidambar formosana]|uniref:Chalcone/stilbene synthase N-terminal domain-containing protein n=1 Tax=Liquidambar formosana TaxID=63359 RepID=A0AAP0S5L8_LIQFO
MVTVEEVRRAQRAEGPATIMAIGTATPPNCVDQSTYPDYYFRITNSEHKTELKEKFQRMENWVLADMEEKRYGGGDVLGEEHGRGGERVAAADAGEDRGQINPTPTYRHRRLNPCPPFATQDHDPRNPSNQHSTNLST